MTAWRVKCCGVMRSELCIDHLLEEHREVGADTGLPRGRKSIPDLGWVAGHKYLTKNNFIFFSEVLEHVFHVVNQMRPAFIRIELYPFVFDKAPQYFYTIQFWRIFWKIKDV